MIKNPSQRKVVERYKAQGLCISCGKSRAPGTKTQYCQYHLDRSRERGKRNKALREEWKAKGLCVVDGVDPALEGLLKCRKHAPPLQALTKEQKDEKIRKKECLKCEKPRLARNKRYCEDHYNARVAGRRKAKYDATRQAGLCVMNGGCPELATAGVYCQKHREQIREEERARYAINKALGVCAQCGITLPPERAGMVMCEADARAQWLFTKAKHYTMSIQTRMNKAQKDAAARGFEWRLTLEEFSNLFYASCEYCARDVEPSEYTGYRIDRKDNDVGYLLENCVPCCAECNWIKGNVLTYEEMCRLIPELTIIRKRREVKQQKEKREDDKGKELITKYKREVYDEEGNCVEEISDEEEYQRAYEKRYGVREDVYSEERGREEYYERQRAFYEKLTKEDLVELLLARQDVPERVT